MDFISGSELLKLCEENHCRISEVMRKREASEFGADPEETISRMKEAYQIMKEACHKPLDEPVASIGGLIGGEAAKVRNRRRSGKSICGSMLSKAITYSLAVLEVNASMGLIVAAPTAGSSGVLPGLLLALEEEFSLDHEQIIDGLFTASAVGYLIMRNATVAGAQAGCQAEVGAASAMAAAAATEIMGGTPKQCMDAASSAIVNLLGLVCDPVAGLVEYPCQSRNVLGASNALVCAEMALSGVEQFIPFDQTVDTMMMVGRSIPFELRETSLGGCAATEAACRKTCEIFKTK
ncbi:L-serine dehydratase [Lacrimispora sphenoides]|jgi:L-serine dehydratase|uniref:L-serine ammonia-lyase, iron-sulfur-dependent, subunit alpha n=1 Tax=Lacrimispora sphenoides TaxID=29370 RepID=UPI0008CB1396|nr:L-serine ammonia-lyase, iron-sulfur-dependent, subunit alpha [Lacrimispora sphenoides]SET67187.1 L-serine dehydratase [Lacrimispora sphenoides]